MIRGILMAWALWFASTALRAESLPVKIRAVEGAVTISTDGGKKWRKAKRGAKLKAGTRLRTAADGKADVEFGKEYALVRLRGDSDLEMKWHRIDGEDHETNVMLRSGKLLATVKEKFTAGSKFEVENTTWVCGVRGHDGFEVAATGGGKALKGTTLIFVFTAVETIFEWTFVHGGKDAQIRGTAKRPEWRERDLTQSEYEALVQEITKLRKAYWKK